MREPIGGIGVSGDATREDNVVYDMTPRPGQTAGVSAGGWSHPPAPDDATAIAAALPQTK